VIGGDVQLDGHRVTALSHFPSVRLGGITGALAPVIRGSTATAAATATAATATDSDRRRTGVVGGGHGGRWYYEVTLLSDGLMQIGWYVCC
jgi:hypothetical protein